MKFDQVLIQIKYNYIRSEIELSGICLTDYPAEAYFEQLCNL